MPLLGWRAVSRLYDRPGTRNRSAPNGPRSPATTAGARSARRQLKSEISGSYTVDSGRLRGGRSQASDHIDRSYLPAVRLRAEPRLRPAAIGLGAEPQLGLDRPLFRQRRRADARLGRGAGARRRLHADRRAPALHAHLRALARHLPARHGRATTTARSARSSRIQLRAEAGAVIANDSAQIPPTLNFLTGGDTTVRGYGYRSIGAVRARRPGRRRAATWAWRSVEWQRPIVYDGKLTDWESAVFVDAGAVADQPGDMQAKVGVGVGVRWRSPIGPVQIGRGLRRAGAAVPAAPAAGLHLLMQRHGRPNPSDAHRRADAAAARARAGAARCAHSRGAWRGLVVLLVLRSAAGAWWWLGSDQSLAFALARTARYLPGRPDAGEPRRDAARCAPAAASAGCAGRARRLAVEVHDARIGWQLAPLLRRRVQLGEVHAAQVLIERRGAAPTTSPSSRWSSSCCPWRSTCPSASTTCAGPVRRRCRRPGWPASYRYTRRAPSAGDRRRGHRRRPLRRPAASCRGRRRWRSRPRSNGRVRAPLAQDRSIDVLAEASSKGTLAGADARLAVDGQLQPVEQAPSRRCRRSCRPTSRPGSRSP